MLLRTSFAVLGIAVALTAGAATAEAGKGSKKNGEHWMLGRVVSTHADKGGGSGTLVVQTHHHNKKQGASTSQGSGTQHTHHTFHVTTATTFEMVHGKQHSAASSAAVHPGARVAIRANGNHAEHVAVLTHQQGQRPAHSSGFAPYRNFGKSGMGGKSAAKSGKKK